MKSIYFAITLSSIMFLLGSCSSDSKKSSDASSTNVQYSESKESSTHSGDNDGHDHSGHDHAGHDHSGHDHSHDHSHDSDDPNKFGGAYVGIWEYHHSSSAKAQGYIGHWIELKGNSTFERGIKGKTINTGKWLLSKHKGETYIEFDFDDNTEQEDQQFRTKMNSPVLLLIGNAPKMNTGEMLKLDKRDKRPE